jgi:hypothetical protein
VASLAPTPPTTTIGDNDTVATPIEKVIYTFTKPFKSGEYNEGIKALQKLLTTLKLYS